MTAGSKSIKESAKGEFIISRVFDAPRERVFEAWTEPDRMKHWWGPKGFPVRSCEMDFRPGGVCHYCLQTPEGGDMWGKLLYREIVPPERLVFTVAFSDEAGNLTRHPYVPDWPRETLTTLTFAEREGKTTLTVRWVPVNPTEAERKTFEAGHESMREGWTGTLDQLAEYLAKA